MSQNQNTNDGSFVVSTVEPGTLFEDNKAVLSFHFSVALQEVEDGFPAIQDFILHASDVNNKEESTLAINVDYDKIPDNFLDANELYGSSIPDDGVFHLAESERGQVEMMISGLEASLKKLKDVKFHVINEE